MYKLKFLGLIFLIFLAGFVAAINILPLIDISQYHQEPYKSLFAIIISIYLGITLYELKDN